MATILITGGAGFIGSHAVDRYLNEGHAVRVLDDFSTGKRENLAAALARIDLIEGDVRDAAVVRRAAQGCELVLHLAAIASVQRSFDEPGLTEDVNLGGTENVLAAARAGGGSRVVLASTCGVYGDPDELPLDEAAPVRPLSPYAASKLAAERLCMSWCDRGGLDIGALRFFNIYGPRQDPSSDYSGVIAIFMSRFADGGVCTVYGDGRQTRDFVYVNDLVDACRRALGARRLGGQPLNVGTGVETSVLDLIAGLSQASGRAADVAHAAARAGDIARSCAARGRALDLLGWEPTTSIADGLALTWRWYLEQAGPAAGRAEKTHEAAPS